MSVNLKVGYEVITYAPGITYAGEVANGNPHGYGVISNATNDCYVGQHEQGRINGLGRVNKRDYVFSGRLDQKGRSLGQIKYHSGHIYNGDVTYEQQPHGKGVIKSPNGDEYVGNFVEGLKTGYGIMRWKEGAYKGLWRNGKPSTIASSSDWTWKILSSQYSIEPPLTMHKEKILFSNKKEFTVYEGDSLDNKPHGKGKLTFLNHYSKGQGLDVQAFNTTREIIFYKEKMLYEGSFQYGYFEGQGKLVFYDLTYYIGEFKKGLPDGPGVMVYKDGSRFEGLFKKGLPHQGKMVWKNIGEYEGLFENGVPAVQCDFAKRETI